MVFFKYLMLTFVIFADLYENVVRGAPLGGDTNVACIFLSWGGLDFEQWVGYFIIELLKIWIDVWNSPILWIHLNLPRSSHLFFPLIVCIRSDFPV